MKQSNLSKTDINEKLGNSSKWLAAAFAAGGVCSILWACGELIALLKLRNSDIGFVDSFQTYYNVRLAAEGGLLAAMLLIAALMFRRISRSGVPFGAETIRSVRTIGIICIFQGLGPHLTAALIARAPYFSPADLFPLHIMAEGCLFLFAAKVMQYGSLLQTEADETV